MSFRQLGIIWLVLDVAAGLAAAQSSAAAPPASAAEAQYSELVSEAVRQYNSGAWADARALFERAHALTPNARTFRGLGLCAFELGRYVDAVEEFEAALADARQPLLPEQRIEVAGALAQARRYVGSVRVALVPAKATLLINGRVAEDRELLLNVGAYRLSANAPGYERTTVALNVEGGQRRKLELALVPIGHDTAGDPGSTQRLLGWAALGVGGAALVAGLIFELERSSTLDERDRICPSNVDCEPGAQRRVDQLTDRARTSASMEVAGFVAGAAFVAGGLALLLTAPDKPAANSRSSAPRLSMHWTGAALSARM